MEDTTLDTLNFDRTTMILLRSHSVTCHDNTVCAEILQRGTPRPRHVLHVDYTRSVDQRVSQWLKRDSIPERLSIVTVSALTRSAAVESLNSRGDTITVSAIVDPSNLTRVGVEISKALDDLHTDHATVNVCFHSLTALLHYADLATVFQFLNNLRSTLEAHDVVAHVHTEPGAMSDRASGRLRPLFDALVDVSLNGSVTVETCV